MDIIQKVEKLYKKSKKFVLSCNDFDGFPYTKVVLRAKYRESIKEVYFCTNTSSKFVELIKNNNKASIYFYNPILYKGCYLKGTMAVCEDMKIKEKYWQNKYKNAYPQKSYTDPDFCVLKFTSISGNYYYWFKKTNFEIE